MFRKGLAEPMFPALALMCRMLLRITDAQMRAQLARMSPPTLRISVSPIGLSIVPLNSIGAALVFVSVTSVGVATCTIWKKWLAVLVLPLGAFRLTVGFASGLITWILFSSSCSGESLTIVTVW